MAASNVITDAALNRRKRGVSAILEKSRCGELVRYWQIASLLAAAALIFSRQPEALLHPQFYGEDGHVWFADAYNRGWLVSLFRTQDGYFQTLPRLAAALALVLPLRFAPLVTNLVGFAVQLLPVPVLLSSRLRNWGPLRFRAALAFLYVALPNSRELNLTVTEAQWHLALVACLLALAETPRGRLGRAFDLAVFALCGLTGPFSIALFAVAVVMFLVRPNKWRWAGVTAFAATAAVQACALTLSAAARRHPMPLGAGVAPFVRILGGQVYSAAVLGANSLASLGSTSCLSILAVAGTGILGVALYRSGVEFQLFGLFSAMLFAASLLSPMPDGPGSLRTGWEFLIDRPAIHYWFFPTLLFSWGIAHLLIGPKSTQLSQCLGILLGLGTLIGFARDWRYSSFPDMQFDHYAAKVMAAKRGDAVIIPETPPGWTLRLVKR
jgi:hypothetical protein